MSETLIEKRWLQAAVALGALVPILAGGLGVLMGTAMLGQVGDAALESHYRYLSGLLLAIGLGYWSAIPKIETQSARISLLTLIVVVGGFCRALGWLIVGPPAPAMRWALIMELLVTPLLYLWQARIARLAAMDAGLDQR